ncbi:MAG: hypothetical protein QM489_03750 [Candidatus Izemoplasma sp.]
MKKMQNIVYFILAISIVIALYLLDDTSDTLTMSLVVILFVSTSIFTYSNRRKR